MSGRHSCTWEAEMSGVPAHVDLCVDRVETAHFLCQADTAVPGKQKCQASRHTWICVSIALKRSTFCVRQTQLYLGSRNVRNPGARGFVCRLHLCPADTTVLLKQRCQASRHTWSCVDCIEMEHFYVRQTQLYLGSRNARRPGTLGFVCRSH